MTVYAVKDVPNIHEQSKIGSDKVHQFVMFELYIDT